MPTTTRDEDDKDRFICAFMDPFTRSGCFETATKKVVLRERMNEVHVCDRHARELLDRGVAEERT